MTTEQPLAASAKTAILWSGGFTVLRDVLQFFTMLILVRLLSPEDYGSAALAQSIVGVVAVFSFGTFVLHAFQLRDPAVIDWQAHFTAATVINLTLFLVTLLIAWGLSFSATYRNAALPLAGMATVFVVEIAGTLRHRMLETRHDWKRFRVLAAMGTVLALVAGVAIALLGGGIWALVVQPPLFGIPAAIDLFWKENWRPDWTWSWARYRETAAFGVNRMGAAAVLRGRQAAEQSLITSAHGFAALGIFSRSLGLATLIAGRIGIVATTTLYPIITRAEAESAQFQRMAGMVLRGVCWTTVPSAVFLALAARDVVALLYGPKWDSVIALLPYATGVVALSGITATLSSLLLANIQSRIALALEVTSAVAAVGIAAVFIPDGLDIYLPVLGVAYAVILLVMVSYLINTNGLSIKSLVAAIIPPLVASVCAVLVIKGYLLFDVTITNLALSILISAVIFTAGYVGALRAIFPVATGELLNVVPGGQRIQSLILLR